MQPFDTMIKYYADGDSRQTEAYLKEGDVYKPFDLNIASKGFVIFVFSLLKCKLHYLFANLDENAIKYRYIEAKMLLNSDELHVIAESTIHLSVFLPSLKGLTPELKDFVFERVDTCPVSRNLINSQDLKLTIEYTHQPE